MEAGLLVEKLGLVTLAAVVAVAILIIVIAHWVWLRIADRTSEYEVSLVGLVKVRFRKDTDQQTKPSNSNSPSV